MIMSDGKGVKAGQKTGSYGELQKIMRQKKEHMIDNFRLLKVLGRSYISKLT